MCTQMMRVNESGNIENAGIINLDPDTVEKQLTIAKRIYEFVFIRLGDSFIIKITGHCAVEISNNNVKHIGAAD